MCHPENVWRQANKIWPSYSGLQSVQHHDAWDTGHNTHWPVDSRYLLMFLCPGVPMFSQVPITPPRDSSLVAACPLLHQHTGKSNKMYLFRYLNIYISNPSPSGQESGWTSEASTSSPCLSRRQCSAAARTATWSCTTCCSGHTSLCQPTNERVNKLTSFKAWGCESCLTSLP